MKNQQGMTLIGMLFVAAVIVFCAILAMKIIPAYIENYTVVSSAKALNKLPQGERNGPPSIVRRVLMEKLNNQLYVNGIVGLGRKNIRMKLNNKIYVIQIDYEKRVPLFANLTLLIHFNDTVNVNAGKT